MSKYNHYAKELDQAFIEARKAFSDAYKKMQRAAAAYEEMQHWTKPETHPGENEWQLARTKADYLTAQSEFEEINGRVWKELDAKKKELTAALRAELDTDSLADPGAVDMPALELMRSGVMTAADYRALAEKYKGNNTMRRLVAHYAQTAADSAQDSQERAHFALVARGCEDSTLWGWETLCGIMGHCAGGRPGRRGDPDFVSGMSSKWEELTQAAIESF